MERELPYSDSFIVQDSRSAIIATTIPSNGVNINVDSFTQWTLVKGNSGFSKIVLKVQSTQSRYTDDSHMQTA